MSNMITGSVKSGTVAFGVFKLLSLIPDLIFKPIAWILHKILDPYLPESIRWNNIYNPYADEEFGLVKMARTIPNTLEEAIEESLPRMRANCDYDQMSPKEKKESDEWSIEIITAVYSSCRNVLNKADKCKVKNNVVMEDAAMEQPKLEAPKRMSAGELLALKRGTK